jgi:probable HAF family extracellular repeat protein
MPRYRYCFAGLLPWAGLASLSAQTYVVTELVPGDKPSNAFAINNAGQVAGVTGQSAFLWSRESGIQELPAMPGYNANMVYGINTRGHVAGCSLNCNAGGCVLGRAFLYRDASLLDLNAGVSSCAWAVNQADQVVGGSGDQAFFWNNGSLLKIGNNNTGDSIEETEAHGINESGVMAGTRWQTSPSGECYQSPYAPCHFVTIGYSFRWANGSFITMDPVPGTMATAINNSGMVTGSFNKDGHGHAFLSPGFALFDLGTLDGHNSSSGSAINNSGEVVGWSSQCSVDKCVDSRAFLYREGAMIDLNGKVRQTEWRLTAATAINDLGQIVVTGYKQDQSITKALLLTPLDAVLQRGRPRK